MDSCSILAKGRLLSKELGGRTRLLAIPAAAWLIGFLLVPLFFILVYSFARRGTYGSVEFGFTLGNYARSWEWIYLQVFFSSLKLALLTSVFCLCLGFPVAYIMARAQPRIRSVLLLLVVVPFWTNFVVRTYALRVLLAENGPLNSFALSIGLISEPISFLNTSAAVWMGMVTNYLPFTVLPLYVALEKFDFALLDAARDLGAGSWEAFRFVMLPLIRPGIVTGFLFVFAPALGEFVIPDLMGGARTLLLGNLVTDQFLKSRDWPFGSALSLLLILIVMLNLTVYLKSAEPDAEREGSI